MRTKSDSVATGQILVGVIMILMLLMIMVPAVVQWVQLESRSSVKAVRSGTAFSLADAAIDRGIWKLKSSTDVWSGALNGEIFSGYNFDSTYKDVPGGEYRIKFIAGPSANQVTIYGEGRDASTKETRSIECIMDNAVVPGALFAQGVITFKDNFIVIWGPISSHSNINFASQTAADQYWPRKLSRQVVYAGSYTPYRDVNGLDVPNTDNKEWWSDYDVPDMPRLDFDVMKASAVANGTYNVCTGAASGVCKFNNSASYTHAGDNLIWYWDSSITTAPCSAGSPCTSVELSGSIALKGQFYFRGNMTVSGADAWPVYAADVPSQAWREYMKCDTEDADEYPADAGYQTNDTTFTIGVDCWDTGNCFQSSDIPAVCTSMAIGIRGFVYVGGNYTMQSSPSIHGAVWVVGTVTRNGVARSMIFYDHQLRDIPVLNVVLQRSSWKETTPKTDTWVP